MLEAQSLLGLARACSRAHEVGPLLAPFDPLFAFPSHTSSISQVLRSPSDCLLSKMSTPFPVGVPDAEIPTHFGGDGWEEVCKALDAIKGWIKADKIERTVEDLRTPLKLIWPSLGAGSRGVVLNVLNRTRKAICGKSLVVNDIVDLLVGWNRTLHSSTVASR